MNKKEVYFTAVNLLLAVAVFFRYDPLQWFPEGYKGAPALLSEKSAESIKEIHIRSSYGEYQLKKDKDSWFLITEGKSFKADQEKTEAALRTLTESHLYYEVPVTEESLKKYGFTENGHAVSAEAVTGDGVLSIRFAESGSFSQSVVYIPQKNKIWSLESDLTGAFGFGRLYHFRKKNLLPEGLKMDPVSLIKIYKINKGEKTGSESWRPATPPVLEIARSADLWQMVKPVPSPAMQAETESLAESFLNAEAADFSADLPDAAKTGAAYAAEIIYKKDVMVTESHRISFFEHNGEFWSVTSEGDYAKLPRFEAERWLEAAKNPLSLADRR